MFTVTATTLVFTSTATAAAVWCCQVASVQGGPSPYQAAKEVCQQFGIEIETREGAAANPGPAVIFRDLLEGLLALKPPDLLVQLAVVLLPHVPQLSPTEGVVEDLPVLQDTDDDTGR